MVMHFRTQSDWADNNPAFAVFDEPGNPSYRWRAVELTLAIYYYHLHLVTDTKGPDSVGFDIILDEFSDALDTLRNYPNSTIALQTPAWANNGEPGLYRVVAIYKSTDPVTQPYIVECANDKMYVLDFGCESENINPATVEKDTIWTLPIKRKRP